jgi:hypothetical protein
MCPQTAVMIFISAILAIAFLIKVQNILSIVGGVYKLKNFKEELKAACKRSADELRKSVVTKTDENRLYREQRQEAQMVAETYHKLLKSGYKTSEFFLEYVYKVDGVKRKLKPDLIFEENGFDNIVEFKVFWEGDIDENSQIRRKKDGKLFKSTIDKIDLNKIQLYHENSRFLNIRSICLVLAYVGPNFLDNRRSFSLKSFEKSFGDILEKMGKLDSEVIVC